MDANEFIGKLKANNTAKDITDLDKVFEDYKVILDKLPTKDRAPLSLNVLCVLCRNLDKAPKWRDRIDNKALLVLSIDCVRETRAMEKSDRVKTLACIYHIHRHVVRQTSPVPPELILKISFMPFELEAKYLLNEYAKTYWNILVDRLSYVERLRNKIPIIKLLPKITEDALKIIEIYDTVQFCSNIIVFLIKKLHFLYTEKFSKELNRIYKEIFAKISEKDFKVFKQLNNKDIMDVYVKLNECLYVVAENASRTYFKESPLDNIVRTCISIVGHCADLFHCFQTFYSNAFCCIFTSNTHLSYSETVLNSLLLSIQTTEKLGYSKAMMATYPYLNQFLRLYIDYNVNNCTKKLWKDNFSIQIQEICLKLMQILIGKLKYCEQMLKCDGCALKSGLHDSLRLSFLVKNFLTVSITQNLVITDTFTLIHDVILEQYNILNELNELGCTNYEKCFRKLQTDIHNTAIFLNKAEYYEFSIKLFKIYLNNEMKTLELKNISRALYNKSICELDSKLFEDALIDAFLSLVYAEGLDSDKYMSLVMDIKAKELKASDDNDVKNEELQMLSVIDACKRAMERNLYRDMTQFLKDLKFSELLKHEFALYARLWPSVTPIGGVWRSLLQLTKGDYSFTDAEASWALYEVILETPAVVRNITNEHFNTVLTELLGTFNGVCLTPDLKIVYSSLLFLKTEFELAAASQKYGWKLTEPVQTLDPDQIPANRTIPQEYSATKTAIQAVLILAQLSPDFNNVTKTKCLQNSLHIYQVFVQLLLHLSRDMEGLQLAYICCCIAELVNDKEAYVRNAGTLLYHGSHPELKRLISPSAMACHELSIGTTVIFLCNASIYYSRSGSVGTAAQLARLAQAQILAAMQANPDTNLDLAIGRLLEAQSKLCPQIPDAISSANCAQRHYLAIGTTGTKWLPRRLHSLTVRVHSLRTTLQSCAISRALQSVRRARASAAAVLCGGAGAAARAGLYVCVTDVCSTDDAQIKIDNRLKHVLGLQPSNETQPYYSKELKKEAPFTPKQEIETMLENLVFKKAQSSPSLPCTSVPAFKVPDWFEHSENCQCYACSIPICCILACHTSGLEAAVYFRANEGDIARNYFNGVIKMIYMTEEKLRTFKNKLYEGFLVDSVMRYYMDWLREVKVEILMEMAFFELKNREFEVADEHIIEIHEILQEISSKNDYVYNNVMNLMTCSAQLRKVIKKPENDLEIEFESLRISPVKFIEPPKTPITKPAKPPQIATKIIVKDEELPKKRKVIKLNLDDGDDKDFCVKKSDFKVPILMPSTTKHVLQTATPISKSKPRNLKTDSIPSTSVTKSKRALKSQLENPSSKFDSTEFSDNFATPLSKVKPKVMLTQPSEETSPKDTTLYSTPHSTPDQFFTPSTSIKTYTKKSLRLNIVKNLEQEFSTPSVDKKFTQDKKDSSLAKKDSSLDKKESSVAKKDRSLDIKEKLVAKKESSLNKKDSSAAKKDSFDKENGKVTLQVPKSKTNVKKTLKRATSPGKLCKEARELPRTRRLRKPVNFSIDEDNDRR